MPRVSMRSKYLQSDYENRVGRYCSAERATSRRNCSTGPIFWSISDPRTSCLTLRLLCSARAILIRRSEAWAKKWPTTFSERLFSEQRIGHFGGQCCKRFEGRSDSLGVHGTGSAGAVQGATLCTRDHHFVRASLPSICAQLT